MKKNLLLLCLTNLMFASAALAGQAVGYPEDKPMIDLTFPDEWEVEFKEGALFATPKDDDSFIVSLAPMEATPDKPQEAIQEVKDLIEADFKEVEYEELQKLENEGVAILLLQAKGEDDDGPANIANSMISQPEAESLYLLQFISSVEGFEKHGADGLKVIQSVKAHGAVAVQTYSYPTKEAPVFALDFPADWKLQADAEGAYVESPDKLVAMNVLLIDQGELPVALETLKKQTGGKFESIEWSEPEVIKDEALGLTATFHHGMAESEGKKYSVNFAEYVRKDGDKFLVLICQHPLAALKTHADAIEQTLKSIKVK